MDTMDTEIIMENGQLDIMVTNTTTLISAQPRLTTTTDSRHHISKSHTTCMMITMDIHQDMDMQLNTPVTTMDMNT
jgi:hypothetical protein